MARRRRPRLSAIDRAARRLGIRKLRPQQVRVIQQVLRGKDALAVLPTGFGKSACYQVPSMLLSRPVVVVSPLLALLEDQYEKLVAREIPAVRLDSTVRGKKRTEALERIREGGSLLVMTTPETLASEDMRVALEASGIGLVAVDEAHAASEWGHDFRPAYLRLGEVLSRYNANANAKGDTDTSGDEDPAESENEKAPAPDAREGATANPAAATDDSREPDRAAEAPAPLAPARHAAPGRTATLALTATATEAVRKDLVRILNLDDPLVIADSPDRPNLQFEVIECSGAARLRALTRLVLRIGRPGIVYCSTTKDVDAVYGALSKLRIPVQRYHGKMNRSERSEQQELFMRPGRRVVMVATSAFGLGIDKANIRYIVHFQAPASLEQYVQEAGRAGRDGKPAHCVLLYSGEDRQIHEFLQSSSRVRPDQLFRTAATLASWLDEDREPSVPELASTAGVARRVAQAVLAVFEDVGLVALETGGRIVPLVPGAEIKRESRLLVERLDHLRTRDERRLDAIEQYATTRQCRAQLLRDYFGVPVGEPCGRCDVCRGGRERPEAFFKPLERKATVPGQRKNRRRRRRRGRRRRRPSQPTTPATPNA